MTSRALRPGLLLLVAFVASSCILVSSCVFVRLEEDFTEDWLGDVIHGGEAQPASFDHGEVDISIFGGILGLSGDLEMNFVCEPGEVDSYFEGVCGEVETIIIEDRDGRVTRTRSEGPRRREYEYHGEEGNGDVEVVVRERGRAGKYELQISWRE